MMKFLQEMVGGTRIELVTPTMSTKLSALVSLKLLTYSPGIGRVRPGTKSESRGVRSQIGLKCGEASDARR
jgi:hypothetical protein